MYNLHILYKDGRSSLSCTGMMSSNLTEAKRRAKQLFAPELSAEKNLVIGYSIVTDEGVTLTTIYRKICHKECINLPTHFIVDKVKGGATRLGA